MSAIDALVMGRNTFEKVLSFGIWPYDKPVFVASNSLPTLASELMGKAFLLRGTPQEMVAGINQQGFSNLYIDGGQMIQSFLRVSLIDELIVTTVPTLLGGGIPLFGSLQQAVQLELISSEVLLNQLVKTRYKVKHEAGYLSD